MALADALAGHASLDAAFASWDAARSAVGAEVFAMGRALGQHLVEATPEWDSMDHAAMEDWWREVIDGRRWFWIDEVADWHPTGGRSA